LYPCRFDRWRFSSFPPIRVSSISTCPPTGFVHVAASLVLRDVHDRKHPMRSLHLRLIFAIIDIV
jgi:hypothetical protein